MNARRQPIVIEKIRGSLFASWSSAFATLAALWLAWRIIPPFLDWALIRAVWSPDHAALCRDGAHGACWAFIADKYRFILFGTYPAEQQWRPALVIALLIALYAYTASRSLSRGNWSSLRLAAFWLFGLIATGVLMWGGLFGLDYVENERWGGLTLTLLISTIGLACAFPVGVLLALGRRSDLPLIRWFSIGYIELIRGVPLISVLFMASVMFPLFLPSGVSID